MTDLSPQEVAGYLDKMEGLDASEIPLTIRLERMTSVANAALNMADKLLMLAGSLDIDTLGPLGLTPADIEVTRNSWLLLSAVRDTLQPDNDSKDAQQ